MVRSTVSRRSSSPASPWASWPGPARDPRMRQADGVGVDLGPIRQQHRTLDRVAQLAHVAGPRVGCGCGRRRPRGEPDARPPELARELARGSARRAAAMSSRRSRSGGSAIVDHVRGGSRGPRGTRPRAIARLEVAVRGGDDAHVDADRLACRRRARTRAPASTRRSFACGRGGMSPISSRKSVPPSRLLEAADALRVRAGERAALVTEELGLEQRLGERRAVDRHEGRRGRAASAAWTSPRDELLARAGLAGDEHGGARRRRRGARARRPSRSAGLVPTILGPARSAPRAPRAAPSPRARRRPCSTARVTRASSCSRSKGFCTKSKAPRRMASTAVSTLP